MGNVIALGIDPGLTIGLATIRVENGKIVDSAKSQVQWGTDFVNFLGNFAKAIVPIIGPDSEVVIVMEDFALLEQTAEQMARNKRSRKMEVTQVIGAVKLWCAQNAFKLVLQEAKLNPMNAKHSGCAIPRDHSRSHKVIAFNHAHHYLLVNNHIKHRLLEA